MALKSFTGRIRAGASGLALRIRARRPFRRFGALTALIVAIALLVVGLFYVRTNMRLVQIGYDIANLEKTNKELKKRKEELLVELSALQSPGDLEAQARKRAGLVFPDMGKVVHVP